MPPEQARGARTDHRADIYGVGAMLYRALTGRLPFDAVDPGEALSMVLTEEPPRPRSIDASIPEALELVIQRAMSKDPEDRYQSMAEFEEALAPFDPLTMASLSMTPSAPNAARPVNPRAVTLMSQSSVDLARTTREAKLARPTLAVLSLIAYVWTVGCFVDGIGGALAVVRATALSRAEVLVIALTVGAASITPAVFWVRYVRSIWHNSVRAVERANSLRRLAIAAIFPYGLLALVSRMLGQGGDPEWSVALSAASLTIAAGTYAVERFSRRRRA
jgi:serine/threonine-protein kinase